MAAEVKTGGVGGKKAQHPRLEALAPEAVGSPRAPAEAAGGAVAPADDDQGFFQGGTLEGMGLRSVPAARPAPPQPKGGAAAPAAPGWVSAEEAHMVNAMAEAALKAKQRAMDALSASHAGVKQELAQERARRRAAEASDEDSGFLRQQMEALLKEKGRLAQENARLTQENQNLLSEVMLLKTQFAAAAGALSPAPSAESGGSVGRGADSPAVLGAPALPACAAPAAAGAAAGAPPAAITPQSLRRLASPEAPSREVQEARLEAEELRAQMREMGSRFEGKKQAWKAQEAALLRCLSEQSSGSARSSGSGSPRPASPSAGTTPTSRRSARSGATTRVVGNPLINLLPAAAQAHAGKPASAPLLSGPALKMATPSPWKDAPSNTGAENRSPLVSALR